MEKKKIKKEKLENLLQNYDAEFSDGFTEKLMKKIEKEEIKPSTSNSWMFGVKVVMIPAAAIVIFMLAINFYSGKTKLKEYNEGISSFESDYSTSLILSTYNY